MNADVHLMGASEDTGPWCDASAPDDQVTTDPHDADCTTCLRLAAEYGAQAAVRLLAVENAGQADPELIAERDAALKSATLAKKALAARGLFVCEQCEKTRSIPEQVGYEVPGDPALRWCKDCKADARR